MKQKHQIHFFSVAAIHHSHTEYKLEIWYAFLSAVHTLYRDRILEHQIHFFSVAAIHHSHTEYKLEIW
jgi:hypothetical protein